MPIWDVVMLLALAYTAIATPFEVAFIDEGPCITILFGLNRFIDLLFVIDIFLIFSTHYQDRQGRWIRRRGSIAINYARGWFIIDFLSILPFYLPTFLLADDIECTLSGMKVVDELGSGMTEQASSLSRASQSIRMIRLLRMLKLARIFKASRVLKRMVQDLFMTRLEMTFAMIKVLQLFAVMVWVAHLQACLWALVSSYLRDSGWDTWVEQFKASEALAGRTVSPGSLYITAIYWSIMTLTSIGYGDVSPGNDVERLLASVLMIVSATTWAYVIGTAAGIAATLDPNTVAFRTNMDALNHFMKDRKLPTDMRHTLRDFFTDAREVHQVDSDASLLAKMSPLLQGNVALVASKEWLEQVWFLKGMGSTKLEREFIAALSMQLGIRAYALDERLPIGQMYVLRRGMVVKLWRFLGKGRVWGEDMLLDNQELVDHSQAVALTFVEAFTLKKEDLLDLGGTYPEPWRIVSKRMRRIVLQRALLFYLAKVNSAGAPRSYVTQSSASGYSMVKESLSVEQRLDRLQAGGRLQALVATVVPDDDQAADNQVLRHEDAGRSAGEDERTGRPALITPSVETAAVTALTVEEVPSPRFDLPTNGGAAAPLTDVVAVDRRLGADLQKKLHAVMRMQEQLYVAVQTQSQAALDLSATQLKMQTELRQVSSALSAIKGSDQNAPRRLDA